MARLSTYLLLGDLLALAGIAQGQTFALPVAYPLSYQPNSLVVADFTGDGKPDLLTAQYVPAAGTTPASGRVLLLAGSSGGAFQPAMVCYTPASGGIRLSDSADLNSDGKVDLLVSGYDAASSGVLLGNGNGTFQPLLPFGGGTISGLLAPDLTGDGRPDLVTIAAGGVVSIRPGTGLGTFAAAPASYPSGLGTGTDFYSATAADLNGDGRPDVVVGSVNGGRVSVLLNSGAGVLQAPMTQQATTGAQQLVNQVCVADVNGDTYPNVLVPLGISSQIAVLAGTAGGALQPPVLHASPEAPSYLALGDLNGDGRPDVLANSGSNGLSLLASEPAGTLQAAVPLYVGPGVKLAPFQIVDVNADGRPDIVTVNGGNQSLSVLLNTTPLASRTILSGTSASLAPNPASVASTLRLAGLPARVFRVQATVLNATGREVARYLLPTHTGTTQVELPTTGLVSGTYLVQLAAIDNQGTLVGTLPAQRLSVR